MKPPPGTIIWRDLTVPDAERVRDFYAAVIGWEHDDVSMGTYDDYNMRTHDAEEPAAGICHQRGPNESIPPQWIMYIQVADLDLSIDSCEEHGGLIVDGPRTMGGSRVCIVRDPAGACIGLVE